MPEPNSNQPHADPHVSSGRRQFRLPHLDFVAVMLIILVVMLVFFLTAEMWLPHWGE